MKKPIKIILIVLAVIVGLFAALLIWLTATQLNVKTETAVVTRGDNSTAAFAPGDEVSILSWNIGYAGLAAYKKEMQAAYNYVALVDCGDSVQGDVIGTLSKGEYLVDIMNEVGYDFASFGNHEFDYTLPQLQKLIDKAKYQYLCCNLTYTAKDGTNRTAVEVVANNINFCGSKADNPAPAAPAGPRVGAPAADYNQMDGDDFAMIEDEGDLPF